MEDQTALNSPCSQKKLEKGVDAGVKRRQCSTYIPTLQSLYVKVVHSFLLHMCSEQSVFRQSQNATSPSYITVRKLHVWFSICTIIYTIYSTQYRTTITENSSIVLYNSVTQAWQHDQGHNKDKPHEQPGWQHSSTLLPTPLLSSALCSQLWNRFGWIWSEINDKPLTNLCLNWVAIWAPKIQLVDTKNSLGTGVAAVCYITNISKATWLRVTSTSGYTDIVRGHLFYWIFVHIGVSDHAMFLQHPVC